jgi:hypothetical protein
MTLEQIVSQEVARAAARRALKAVSNLRKALVRHDYLIGRDMDLISQSMDLVACSRARLVVLQIVLSGAPGTSG